MKVLVTAVVAAALHLLLGWAWTLAAGVLAGAWAGRRGWLLGAAGVGAAWAGFLAYDFAVAAQATGRMALAMGGIIGDVPAAAVAGATVLIGVLLGAAGGAVGTQAAALVRGSRQPAAA